MYTVAVRRQFIARHYLIGNDWGEENREHSHHYSLEVSLEGIKLNKYGYLMDINLVNALLDKVIIRLRDRVLNNIPEFSGLNPSIEHLAGICCRWMEDGLTNPPITAICVKIVESEDACASVRHIIA
jgi:6-pyruvoyltetrahydropterin/6-carboxytetrahydropterin synthase